MYNIKVTKLPSRILRMKSRKVVLPLREHDDILIKKLIYHIDESQKPNSKFQTGIGVAAVQQGRTKQIFYINTLFSQEPQNRYRDVLINPTILEKSKELIALETGEGCLSVPQNWPSQLGYVPRHKSLKVEAFSYFQKKTIKIEISGFLAIVFQHELDHLQGKLFIDRINKKDPFDKSTITDFIGRI